MVPAGVAQLVRARGSYPRCPGFKSLHRHQSFDLEIWECGNVEISTFPNFHMVKSLSVRALETIRRHGLARPGERVLVGLSGGADSVALLLVLRELEQEGALAIAGA